MFKRRDVEASEASNNVRPNVLEELNNSIPSRIEDPIKAKGGATNTDFIGSMHTGMLLCFHWNLFKVRKRAKMCMLLCFYWNILNIHIQMLSDYTLISFIEIKWHENSITCMVKHRPLMYKNVKKLLKYCVVK